MTVTAIPAGHFQGGRGINVDPTTGDDLRSLEDVLNEIITGVNNAEDAFTIPITSAATFPTPAAVVDGQMYRVTVAATDNNPAKTNTGQAFIAGDEITWNGTNWTLVGNGISTATPQDLGVSAAGTSANKSNADHVHAHGDLAGGTLHADVVAGVSDGFMTAAQATMLAAHDVSIGAIVDDHVFAKVTALNMKVDESEQSAALSGAAGKRFLATHVLVKSIVNVGATNADGTINIGTAADGAQIAAALALTGVGAVDTGRMIPLAAHAVPVAGNATLYVNVESAETGVGTLQLEVTVVGRQI